MIEIEIRQDKKRGCGWRKPGGIYLVSAGLAAPCGKLPIPLTVCPTCGNGVKPARGWTWIDGTTLAKCPMSGTPKVGLLWVGDKFYSPDTFTREAAQQGVSRRISTIPKDFKLGETWVWFAHRKAITEPCPDCKETSTSKCKRCDGDGSIYTAGIFHAFKPTAIEYVVKGDESDEELERIVKRGITPVRIEKVNETKPLLAESA